MIHSCKALWDNYLICGTPGVSEASLLAVVHQQFMTAATTIDMQIAY